MSYELRPYQKKAEESILKEWENGNRKTVLNLATGLGKTIVFSNVARHATENGERVLVLAHRGELLDQAAEKISEITGCETVYEKAEQTAFGSDAPITIASVQSLSRDERLRRFPKDYYSTIIVDEAHHSVSNSYQKVLKHFGDAKVLGVTATPDRGDKLQLSTYYDSEAYEYGMIQGIHEGYLCPIKACLIPLEMDIREVGMSAGDFSLKGADEAIMPYLEAISKIIAEEYADRKTVIFLPLVKTSKRMAQLLNEAGLSAVEINGETPDRAERFKDFREGKYQVLCNAMLATEGWDCPPVDCVVILRPTKIRSFYQQMVGRGTRLYPGKNELLLLDFLWLTDKHGLCRPTSLVSKNEEIDSLMMKRFMSRKEYDILELEQDAEADAIEAREQALAAKLKMVRGRKKKIIDPIEYAMSIGLENLINYAPIFGWEKMQPTESQLKTIEKSGINIDAVTSKGLAHAIISTLVFRSKCGLSTPKQIRCLENYGFNHVGKWDFGQASKMIQTISNNHWTVPKSIDVNKYDPAPHRKGEWMKFFDVHRC